MRKSQQRKRDRPFWTWWPYCPTIPPRDLRGGRSGRWWSGLTTELCSSSSATTKVVPMRSRPVHRRSCSFCTTSRRRPDRHVRSPCRGGAANSLSSIPELHIASWRVLDPLDVAAARNARGLGWPSCAVSHASRPGRPGLVTPSATREPERRRRRTPRKRRPRPRQRRGAAVRPSLAPARHKSWQWRPPEQPRRSIESAMTRSAGGPHGPGSRAT